MNTASEKQTDKAVLTREELIKLKRQLAAAVAAISDAIGEQRTKRKDRP